MDREQNKYRVLKRRKVNQEFKISVARIKCTYYRGRFYGTGLVRMVRLEQRCMEQYLKYKEAAINYENALAADDNIKVSNLSEKEYKEVIKNIRACVQRVEILRKYVISTSADAREAKKMIRADKEQKLNTINELEQRIELYDEKLYLLQELKKYAPIKYEYEMLQGKAKEKYQQEHIIELDKYQIIRRELAKTGVDSQMKESYQEIKEKLYDEIDRIKGEIQELDKEDEQVNDILNNSLADKEKNGKSWNR